MNLPRCILIACCLSILAVASHAFIFSGVQRMSGSSFSPVMVTFLSRLLSNLGSTARFSTTPSGEPFSYNSPVEREFNNNQILLRRHGLGSNSNEEEDSAHNEHQFTEGSSGSPAKAQDENEQRIRAFPDTQRDKS